MSKEKLVRLFKQCCDNPEFKKGHGEISFKYDKIDFSVKEQPFKMSDKISNLIAKGGYTVKDVANRYIRVNYGRVFEFNGEPPLKLSRATLALTLLMDSKHIKLGDVEEEFYIKKNEKWVRKTFWRDGYYKEYDSKHKFLKRTVEIDSKIRKANCEIWRSNQTDGSFDFITRSAHRYEKPNMIIVSNSYKRKDASNFWFREDLDIIESSHHDSDMADYDNVMSGIQHDHMKVCGGILSFGDVWVWLEWDEYKELLKYYNDSIKKTHEVILNQRLKETKNG